ncbi:hypothetical protein JOC26_001640 [Sporohalobacter salinus]|nr:hypothetical protein [Sporohalobacter salinus]
MGEIITGIATGAGIGIVVGYLGMRIYLKMKDN